MNDTWGILWFYPYTAAMFNIMCNFPKFVQAYYNLSDEIYLPQNFCSLKSMEGFPLTTLCVRVSDPHDFVHYLLQLFKEK